MITVQPAAFPLLLTLSHTYLAASTNPGQLGAPSLTGKNVYTEVAESTEVTEKRKRSSKAIFLFRLSTVNW
jgi:hypothetical protein